MHKLRQLRHGGLSQNRSQVKIKFVFVMLLKPMQHIDNKVLCGHFCRKQRCAFVRRPDKDSHFLHGHMVVVTGQLVTK